MGIILISATYCLPRDPGLDQAVGTAKYVTGTALAADRSVIRSCSDLSRAGSAVASGVCSRPVRGWTRGRYFSAPLRGTRPRDLPAFRRTRRNLTGIQRSTRRTNAAIRRMNTSINRIKTLKRRLNGRIRRY
jgi:HAMP domain-containing protein